MNGTTTDTLTVSQALLLAAAKLPEPFHLNALAVQAWRDAPAKFGLKGFAAESCDVNIAAYTVMGNKGLASRGWLVKVGPKLYKLSRQGQMEAERIRKGDDSPLPTRRALAAIKVPKDLEAQLVPLFFTAAFRRYEDGMRREITYRDAQRFWGLAEVATGEEVDQALARLPRLLAAVGETLIGDRIVLSAGQEVTDLELKGLGELNRWLGEQFARNLEQQRNRGKRA